MARRSGSSTVAPAMRSVSTRLKRRCTRRSRLARAAWGLPVAALGLSALPAHAGGYFFGTKGARASGRAGAFTARADDFSAVALNPAGLARMPFTLVHAGNRLSHNEQRFARRSTLDWGDPVDGVPPYVEFDTVENSRPWQALDPVLGVTSSLGLRDWGFAFGAYAPAGVAAQDFPEDGGQRYMMVRRDVQMLHIAGAAAWKFKDVFGIGATAQWVTVPKLEYELVVDANVFVGLANPVASRLDMLATIRGRDGFAMTGIVGAWYRPTPRFEIAAAGQVVPYQLKAAARLDVEPLAEGLEHEVELSRDGEEANDVTLSMPMPMWGRLGLRYLHRRGRRRHFDIELNLVYEATSQVDAFVMDGDGLVGTLAGQELDVGRIELDKRWRDTFGVQLGGDVLVVPGWLTLRAGAGYESPSVDPAYMHVDFFGGHQVFGAVGASVMIGPVELALSYGYRRQAAVEVSEGRGRVYQEVPGSWCEPPYDDAQSCHPAYLGQPSPVINGGRYQAQTHTAELDVLYRF
ncbi:MAG: hypothetical protein B7733_04410 [Myxococcales bacterium FL481]|nr:MAG: hypothetical protein B7733_04410 [Myxococcales bacterium FL481]